MPQYNLRKEFHVLASRMGGYKDRDKWQRVLDNAKNRKGLTRCILNVAKPKALILQIVYPEPNYNEPIPDDEVDFSLPGITLMEKTLDDGKIINEFRLDFSEAQKLIEILQKSLNPSDMT
jgi:hypothetical protein